MRLFLICSLIVAVSLACDDRANSDGEAVPGSASDELGEGSAAPEAATEPGAESETAPAPASQPASAPHPQGSGQGSGHGHGAMDQAGMPHDFADVERWSAVFDDPARDAWQQPGEVVRIMGLAAGMTVADIGAGTGYFVPHLSAAVGPEGAVQALDIEASMVAHIQERAEREGLGNVAARVIPTDDPQLEPASVDRVMIVNTWHHIGDREAYTRRLASGLAPGGAVYVVDFTLETERGPPVEHRLPPEAVVAELAAGGLAAEVVEEPLVEQYIVVGRLP